MKYVKFVLIGVLFGIIMTKSEAVSWYRIWEMFQFKSFHMYGIIGSALFFGVIVTQLFKRGIIKDLHGNTVVFKDKDKSWKRYLYGGIIFGLGWAFVGACPGPMFTLIGAGFPSFIIVVLAAVAGTYVYGLLRNKLPH